MSSEFRLGSWVVQPTQSTISRNGKTTRLEPKMVEVLVCLTEHSGETVSKEELIRKVWGDTFVTDDVLTRCISELRKALEDDPKAPRVIETIPRKGYRLLEKVERVEPARPMPPLPVTKWKWWVPGSACLLVLAATVLSLLWPPRPPRLLRITPVSGDEAGIAATLYTDGLRIYYTRLTGDEMVPSVVSVGGGETNAIPTPANEAWIFDVSPDGEQLLLSFTWPLDDGPILLMPVLGGATRRLGNINGHDSRWSKDGKKIVYGRKGELRVVSADGGDDHQLVTVHGTPRWPRWSPDSSRIRFALVGQGDISSLWEVSAHGTNLHPLFPGWQSSETQRIGEWTPDGRYFLFDATRDGLTSLWVLSEGNSLLQRAAPPVRLTVGPMDMSHPIPSKDGKKIFAVGTQNLGELVRYEAKTKQFVRYLSGMSVEGLVYSPDLNSIAYTDFTSETLYRSRPDGSQPSQLTTPPLRAKAPRWSPDGRRIAFMGLSPGGRVKIYVVSADGGTPEELAAAETNLIAPTWSPDGRSLVFGRRLGSYTGEGDFLYEFDLETRTLSELAGSKRLHYPIWSPDGHYLAAAGANDGIKVLNLATHQWSPLTKRGSGDFAWSHDSQYVYMDAGEAGIFRIRLHDGKEEKVADTQGFQRAAGSFGSWLGLTPDDTPLLLRNVSSDRIYALDWEAP